MKYSNLLKTIGNTPMVKLNNFLPDTNLYAKLEGHNPGGSVKDRTALYMIEQAEKRKELTKDKIILEATSGNMGIALSMIGAQKGYRVSIVMSDGMSIERRTILKAMGANLILTDKKLGTQGAIKKAKDLLNKNPDLYWFANQFNNPDNINAHYYGIGREILEEIKNIDYLIAGVGTSGTIIGIAKRLKQKSPQTKIIGVFPPKGYQIQGIQNQDEDFSGEIYNQNLIDEIIIVSKQEAFETARFIAQIEGLFVGMSSGASLFVARQIAKRKKKLNIVVILPDKGDKYLSTDLYL